MTITRASAEAEIIARVGKKMSIVGLDGATVDGSNSDLNGALAGALRGVGITPSSPFTVTDSDLTGVGSDEFDEFMDRAVLRVWFNIQGNLDLVDTRTGTRQYSYNQIAEQCDKAIERLQSKMKLEYGVGVGSLSAGSISRDFQSRYDDEVSVE